MKWVVEARIFNNGKIVSKVRQALDGEESYCKETEKCDIWVDVFENEEEAIAFCKDYKNA
ncbi:MAG: hypothetical protein ACK5LY_06690 [Lachnospirales bacterium]